MVGEGADQERRDTERGDGGGRVGNVVWSKKGGNRRGKGTDSGYMNLKMWGVDVEKGEDGCARGRWEEGRERRTRRVLSDVFLPHKGRSDPTKALVARSRHMRLNVIL